MRRRELRRGAATRMEDSVIGDWSKSKWIKLNFGWFGHQSYREFAFPLQSCDLIGIRRTNHTRVNNLNLAVQFFLQIALILLFCRLVGAIAKRFGQPQVVAEMVAGVLLGPSLFGMIWPEAQSWLFPWDKAQNMRDTQSYLFPASQLGLALYMFVVGMEFRVDIVQKRLRSSIAVSIAGMVTPL